MLDAKPISTPPPTDHDLKLVDGTALTDATEFRQPSLISHLSSTDLYFLIFRRSLQTSSLIPLPPDLFVFYPSCLLSSHTQSQSLDSLQWRLLDSLDSKGDNGCLRLVTRFTRLVSFVDLLALVNLQDWFASSS
ncbi:hypothetical protein Q3G72_016933 [Acer saccharum]|nr:hypothetical protein Q3G72_016933 [Acer saccharum]